MPRPRASLGLREVQEDTDRQLALQALRTIEHAREPLQKAAFASKAEDRARALSLLVSSTGLSRRGMTETLTHLSRLKNEQDPVRHGGPERARRGAPLRLRRPSTSPPSRSW